MQALFSNITEKLSYHAWRRPDHPALIDRDRVIDYRSLDSLVRKTATQLRKRGVKERDIVGLAMTDTPEHLIALLGLIRMGAVLLPMDCRWTDAEKRNVTQFFGAAGAFSDLGPIEGVRSFVVDDEWLEDRRKIAPDEHFPNDAEAPIWLSLSSGTTGIPKGPMLSHRQVTLRFLCQAVTLGFCERDTHILATPLYFGGGRGFSMGHLMLGGTVDFFPPPYQPMQLVEAVRQRQPQSLFLVPTLLRRLLELPFDDGPLFPNLRVLISSGSMLHAAERDKVRAQLSPNFVNLYSSTEGGAVSTLPASAGPDKSGSVGRAAFMNEFEIADENDRPLPTGQIGRIRQRAPWVPDGFYNNPEETKKYFKDGWYYPGDLGRVDDEGYLYIVGRTKDMIIRGGINIYPAEIEAVLNNHDSVHDAAVLPWPSREMGEEVAAFVVTGAHTMDEQSLREHCRASLAPYKVPKRIFFVEQFPKSPLGKILKAELAKQLPVNPN